MPGREGYTGISSGLRKLYKIGNGTTREKNQIKQRESYLASDFSGADEDTVG